jgi:hydroxymethylbilane synthase
MPSKIIKIGSRKSKLALWQSNLVKDYITSTYPEVEVSIVTIDTIGDQTQSLGQALPEIGGKGLFTKELEEALRAKEIDLAVHSLKDLPTDLDSDFELAAISKREPAFDVLVSKDNLSFDRLPKGAVVGTSSLRRSAQLKRLRPDLIYRHIRGNVDTRIAKVKDPHSPYFATVLAHAGLIRLQRTEEISYIFSENEMLPAPAQGALAVQIRKGDNDIIEILQGFHDSITAVCVNAERAFLAKLMAGCSTPVGAYAVVEGNIINMRARCLSEDGMQSIEVNGSATFEQATQLGENLAQQALEKGAKEILK